jgi:hypothetical protein
MRLVLATILGVLVGVFVTVASGVITPWNSQGDIDTKLVELSIGILQAEPKPETSPLREWAINTLQARGKFSFTEAERSVLLKNQLPVLVPGGSHG